MINSGGADLTVSPSLGTLCSSQRCRLDTAAAGTRAADQVLLLPPPVPPPPPNSNSPALDQRTRVSRDENFGASFSFYTEGKPALQRVDQEIRTDCLSSPAVNNVDKIPSANSSIEEHTLQKVSNFRHADLSSFVAVGTAPFPQQVRSQVTERLPSLSAFSDLRAGTQLLTQKEGERTRDSRFGKNGSLVTGDYGPSRACDDHSLSCSSAALSCVTTPEKCFCPDSFIPSSHPLGNYIEKRRCTDSPYRSVSKECNFTRQSDGNPMECHVLKNLGDEYAVDPCSNSSPLDNSISASSLPCGLLTNCVEGRLSSSLVETMISNEDCLASVARATVHENRLVMEGPLLAPSTNCSPLSPHLPLSSGLPGQGSQDSGIASCEPSEEELSLPLLNSRRLTLQMAGMRGSSSDSCQWLGSLESDAATSDTSAVTQSITSHQLRSCFYGGLESTSVKGSSGTEPNLEISCDVGASRALTCCDGHKERPRYHILDKVQASTSVDFKICNTELEFSGKEPLDEVKRNHSVNDKWCFKQDRLNNVELLERENVSELRGNTFVATFECKGSPTYLDVIGCENASYISDSSPYFASVDSQKVSADQLILTNFQKCNLCKQGINVSTSDRADKCICINANSTNSFEPVSNLPSRRISQESIQVSNPVVISRTDSICLHHKYSPLRRTSSVVDHKAFSCSLVHEARSRCPCHDLIYAKSSCSSHISEYASFLTEKILGQALKEIFIPVDVTLKEIPSGLPGEIGPLACSVNSPNLRASGVTLVHRDVDSTDGKVPGASAQLMTGAPNECATQKPAPRIADGGHGDLRRCAGKSLLHHDRRTHRSLSATELRTTDSKRLFDVSTPFRSNENFRSLHKIGNNASLTNECDHFDTPHALECCDDVPQSVPISSQSHNSFSLRKDGPSLKQSFSTSFEPSFSVTSNSCTASSPVLGEAGRLPSGQNLKCSESPTVVLERHCSPSEIFSFECRVEGERNVRPCDDTEDDRRSSPAIGRPACLLRDAKKVRESGDDEDYYPRELSTSDYSDKPSRKPARVNKPLTDLYPNSSQKKKRRLRTRRRSSAGRNRASKTLQESRAGRRSSRGTGLVSDPADVYSQPVDSIAEATVLQPRVVIASQPRRLSHRKHRITSSALSVALPLLNSSTIAGSKNVPLKSAGNEAFARTALPKLSSPKKGTKEKNSRKFLYRKTQKCQVPCDTGEVVPSKESIVCNVGSAHRTSLLSSSGLQSPNLLMKSEACNGNGAPDCEYINLQKSSRRLSRKDKHEDRSLCRLLPFVGMRWCQRKDDHSSESRDEAYVASDPNAAVTSEDKKRGFFSSIRNGLFSFFSFGSDKNDVRGSIAAQANDSGCNGTSDGVTTSVEPASETPQLPPTPSDLLNHSNYSAFTRAPARLPLHEPLGNRASSGFAGPIMPSSDGVDKESLEVLAGDGVVSPALPLISACAAVPGDLGCRSPVGLLNQRALPPLPKSEDSASPPHPPIPPPLPQAVLSAVAVASSQGAADSEPVEGPLSPRDGGTEASAAEVLKADGMEEDGCHFASMIEKVKDYGWYWGPISGKAAEKIVSNEPDGSFIVRDSSDDHYIFSLTFKLNGLTRHVRIEHDQGNFSFGGYTKFKSQTIVEFIESAIEHSRSGRYLFFLHRRPVLGPRRVQLLHPVSRYRHVQSLQHLCRFVIVKNVRRDRLELLPLPGRLLHYLSSPHYYSELVDQLMAEEEEEEQGQKEALDMTLHDNDAGAERAEESNAPRGLETDNVVPVDLDRRESTGDGTATQSIAPNSDRKECGARANDGSSTCSPSSAQDTVPDPGIIPELDDPEDEIGVICNPFECSAVVEALHPFDQSSSSASLSNDVHEFCFVHCQDKEQPSLAKPLACQSPALQAKCSCATTGNKAQYNISPFCNRCIVHSPRSICVGGHRLPIERKHSEEIVVDHQSETLDNSKKQECCASSCSDDSRLTSCSSSDDTARQTADFDDAHTKLPKPVKRRPLSMSSFLCGVPKSCSSPTKVGKFVSYHVDLNSGSPTLIKFTKLLDASGAEISSPQSQVTNCKQSNASIQASTYNHTGDCNGEFSTHAAEGECVRVCAQEGADTETPESRCGCTERELGASRTSTTGASGRKDCSCCKEPVVENDVNNSKGFLPATPILSVIAKSSLEELGTF